MTKLSDAVVAEVLATSRAVPRKDGVHVSASGHDAEHVQSVGTFIRVAQPDVVAALADEVRAARAATVPVPEDDLRRLEQLVSGAQQADTWAWLDVAREDVPRLVAEVRRHRKEESHRRVVEDAHEALLKRLMQPYEAGYPAPVFVSKADDRGTEYVGQVVVEGFNVEVRASTPGEATAMALAHLARVAVTRLQSARQAAPADVRRAAATLADALSDSMPGLRDALDLLVDAASDAAETRALIEKQHRVTLAADALWRAEHSEADTWPDLAALISWLISRAGAGLVVHPEQRAAFERALEVMTPGRLIGAEDRDAAAQALRMVLALPTTEAPPPPAEADTVPVHEFAARYTGSPPLATDAFLAEAARVEGEVGRAARAVQGARVRLNAAMRAAGVEAVPVEDGPMAKALKAAVSAWRLAHGESTAQPSLDVLLSWLLARSLQGLELHPGARERVERALKVLTDESALGVWSDAAEAALRLVLTLPDSGAVVGTKSPEEFVQEASGQRSEDVLEEAVNVVGEVGAAARAVVSARQRFFRTLRAAGWQPE